MDSKMVEARGVKMCTYMGEERRSVASHWGRSDLKLAGNGERTSLPTSVWRYLLFLRY